MNLGGDTNIETNSFLDGKKYTIVVRLCIRAGRGYMKNLCTCCLMLLVTRNCSNNIKSIKKGHYTVLGNCHVLID
jgi:hypothetical protein